jgi:outer membrane receptor protein involved in Fe transport
MFGKTWTQVISIILMVLLASICVLADDQEETEGSYTVEPIEVRGKRLRDLVGEPLSESPGLELSTSVIEQAEIERQGAKTLIDALEYIPGAWVETRGRKVKQFFSTRGQKYPYPEYAVDGAWQREFHEMPYFFSASNVERIQVIRSSAALLMGLSGLAGVINIVPKEYEEPETSGEIEYGTFDSYRFHLSHGATAGTVSYALNAGSDHTEGPEGRNSAEDITNFLGSLRWRPVDSLSIKANLFHLYGERELTQAEPPATLRLQEALERFDPLQSTLFSVKTYFRPSDRASTELMLHYIDRDHTFVSATEIPHVSTREWDYEWGMNLVQALGLSQNNILRVGGLYNHWIAPNGKRFYVGRRTDLETYSAVMVDEHRFGRMILDGGLRWAKTYINDYGAFNINGSSRGFGDVVPVEDEWEPSIFNGSVGAAYYLSSVLSLHLNLASGYIQPRVGTLDVNLEEPKNERRVKLDLGVRAAQEGIGQISLVGFLTQQTDAIVLSGKTEEMNGRVMELYINRDQDQIGAELEAKAEPLLNVVQPFINVTAMRSRAESEGEMERNKELPQFIINGGLYASRSRFDVSVFWKYVSSYESTRFVAAKSGEAPVPQPLGDFHVLNATAGWSLGGRHRARIYVEVKNLTDRKFSTVVGYPDFGRRFTLGLRQAFR